MPTERDDSGSVGAIHGSRLEPLRDRMGSFVADHQDSVDLKALREETSDDAALSELVDEDRDERLD